MVGVCGFFTFGRSFGCVRERGSAERSLKDILSASTTLRKSKFHRFLAPQSPDETFAGFLTLEAQLLLSVFQQRVYRSRPSASSSIHVAMHNIYSRNTLVILDILRLQPMRGPGLWHLSSCGPAAEACKSNALIRRCIKGAG